MEKLLFRNRIFLDRLRGVGVLSKEDAIGLSCTGPIARASGVTYDLRKDEPYLAYPELRFRGPLRDRGGLLGPVHRPHGGDAAEPPDHRRRPSRTCPAGPVNVPIAEKFPLPDKVTAYNSMEGLIQHFELIMPNRGFETPRDEIYAAVESPNGELGYYLVADGSQTAWRVRTRPPSFIHFPGLPAHHQGPPARRRGGRAGKPEHHRRRAGPVSESWPTSRRTRSDDRTRPTDCLTQPNSDAADATTRIADPERGDPGEDPGVLPALSRASGR